MKKNLTNNFPFVCRVAEGGYRLDKELRGTAARAGERRTKAQRWIIALGNEARPVSPPPDLFMDFVKRDPASEEAMLDFAQRYGFLERVISLPLRVELERIVVNENATLFGERLSLWQEHHRQMSEAVELYRMITESPEKLRSRIKWKGDSAVTYEGPSRRSPSGIEIPGTSATIADEARGVHPELLKRLVTGDFVMPARVYLQTVLNDKVHEYAPYQYLWVEGLKRLGGFVAPTCLIGCLWLQLGNALADFSSFRNCEICGKSMLIPPKTRQQKGLRNDRLVCSGTCRTKKWEARKADARRLSAKGMTVSEIAASIGAKEKHVKGWIKPARRSA